MILADGKLSVARLYLIMVRRLEKQEEIRGGRGEEKEIQG